MSNPFPSLGNRPLDQLKVAELRDELRKRGLSLKGVKKDLFERLDEAVRKELAGISGDKDGQGVYPSGLAHDQDSIETSQDDDGMSYLNDGETTQDTSLVVNNALPCAGKADGIQPCTEPHMDVANVAAVEEEMEDVPEIRGGPMDEQTESDKQEDKEVAEPANAGSAKEPSVEPAVEADNQPEENVTELKSAENFSAALENQGSGLNLDVASIETTDAYTSSKEKIIEATAHLRFSGEVGTPDSFPAVQGYGIENQTLVMEPVDDIPSTPVQDDCEAGVTGALEQEILVPEVASASDVVIPHEGDKDIPSASVSDDILNAAGPSSVPAVENVVNASDCPMQDVQVFETTLLTSVSVVTCVQEFGKESDDGAPKTGIFESAKEELVEEDTNKGVFQEGVNLTDTLRSDAEPPVSEAVQELQLSEPEGIDGGAVILESIAQEVQQDIEMAEAHEYTSAQLSSLETTLPAAALEAPRLLDEIKSENIDNNCVDNVGNLKEAPRVGMIEDTNFSIKSEPREAESRVSRRATTVETVKMEQQDVKDEYVPKGRNHERSRPRDYEYNRPRDYESDRFRHNSARAFDERGKFESRSGRQFKEDGRKHMDEMLHKTEDGVDVFSGQKRKDDDRDAKQQEPAKRMRRWNSGNQPFTEVAKPVTSGTVNEIVSPEVKREPFTVPPPKLTGKLPEPSRPALPAAKSGLEANGEKRNVPPSTRPPSASLKIERFVRPFTLNAVKDLLSEFGEYIDFWMDQIKTHCYVTFSKVEEAVAARNGLYDRQWPPAFGNLLIANFVDASEVKLRSDGTFEKTNAPALTTPRGMPNHPSALGNQHGHTNALASAPPLRERQLMQTPVKDPEPPVPTLDDLFRKTKAKPHIYYLPLTDEQVAEKLAITKKDNLVMARNNNQPPIRGRPVGRI